jgi:hypothetical protein
MLPADHPSRYTQNATSQEHLDYKKQHPWRLYNAELLKSRPDMPYTEEHYENKASDGKLGKQAFNRAIGAGVGGSLGGMLGALGGYALGHIHPDSRTGQPDPTLVTPLGVAGGTLGAMAGAAMGRGKNKDDVAQAASTGDLKGLLAQMLSGGSSSQSASKPFQFPTDSDVTIRVQPN